MSKPPRIFVLLLIMSLLIQGVGACSYAPDPFRDGKYTMKVLDKSGNFINEYKLDRIVYPCGKALVYAYDDENQILVETSLNVIDTIDLNQSERSLYVIESREQPPNVGLNSFSTTSIIGYRYDKMYLDIGLNYYENISLIQTLDLETAEESLISIVPNVDLGFLEAYISKGYHYVLNTSLGLQDWKNSVIDIYQRRATFNYPYLIKPLIFTNTTEIYIGGVSNLIEDTYLVFIKYNLETEEFVNMIINNANTRLEDGYASSNGVILSQIFYNRSFEYVMVRYNWETGAVIDETVLDHKVRRVVLNNNTIWMIDQSDVTYIQTFDILNGEYYSFTIEADLYVNRFLITDDFIVNFDSVQVLTILGFASVAAIVIIVVMIRYLRSRAAQKAKIKLLSF